MKKLFNSEGRQFLDMMRGRSDDLVQLLVWCDYLQEQNEQKQEEYIRACVECAKWSREGKRRECRNLLKVLAKRRKRNKEECCGVRFPNHLISIHWRSPLYATVRSITCTLEAWMEYGPRFCEKQPISSISIRDKSPVRYQVVSSDLPNRNSSNIDIWAWWPEDWFVFACIGEELMERMKQLPVSEGRIEKGSFLLNGLEMQLRNGAVFFYNYWQAVDALKRVALEYALEFTPNELKE